MYHDRALAMIGRAPSGAGDGTLPASVAEWYALDDGASLLETFSNRDIPLKPEGFECVRAGNLNLVVFMIENQAVVRWGFDSDQGDDPAVYVSSVDDADVWIEHTKSFSDFIYTQIFDYQWWLNEDCVISGGSEPIAEERMGGLRLAYTEEPSTAGWPGTTQYRFSDGQKRVILWETKGVQADWWLSAPTKSEVLDLFARHESDMEWHNGTP